MLAMKTFPIIIAAIIICVFFPSYPSAHSGEGGKDVFTKHFQETLFAVGEKGQMSIEVLVNDKEYAIGKDVIGIVVHDSHDEDVEGAALQARLSSSEGPKEISGVKEKGGGLYLIPSAPLPKGGSWELRIAVKKKKLDDSARFLFSDMAHNPLPAGKYDRKTADAHMNAR